MAVGLVPVPSEEPSQVGSDEQLGLTFAADEAGSTYAARKYRTYPFHVARTLYMDHDWPEMATVYIQSAAGGVFQGDRLSSQIHVEAGAAAHVTTQSSTKIHSMERDYAAEIATLSVARGGTLEYLVEPFILFPQSDFRSIIRLDVAEGASAIVSEGIIAHAPDGHEKARFCSYRGEIDVKVAGTRVALDRLRIDDAPTMAASSVGMRNHRMQASVFLVMPAFDVGSAITRLRQRLEAVEPLYAGASVLRREAGLAVRMLANSGTALRQGVSACWEVFREVGADKSITPRRK